MKTDINNLTKLVIGAAMAVHRALGPGFLESVYQKALAVELKSLGIRFREQVPLVVVYGGQVVGEFVADFVVNDDLILELKSALALATTHEVQLVNYLNATGVENGLLINFGAPSLEFRRKFKNPKNPVNLVNSVKKTAFTVLELLVAMTLMSILLVLLLNMVDGAARLWRESEGRVDSCREARAALGIISRDLQNAVTGPSNANQFLLNAAAFANLDSVGNLVSDASQGASLFFLAALPAKAQDSASNKSDVCQVGYFLAFGQSSSATNSPVNTLNIYRYILSSDATFPLLANSPPFPNNLATTDTRVELLARNITRFSVRAYTLTNHALAAFSASSNTPLPDLVEISLSAVSQDASKKLGTTMADFSAWTATSSTRYSNIITPVEQTFTTRIRLNRPQ